MNTIDEIWQELFGCNITAHERRVMERIAAYTDSDESTFISSAVTVHCLYSVLILDPESPVRIGALANNSLRELRKQTERMIRVTNVAHTNVSELFSRSQEVLEAFDTAERFAKWQRNNRITVYEKSEHPFCKEYSVSLDVVGIFLAACIASSIVGALVAGGIGLMVLGGG